MQQPFVLNGRTVTVTTSVGIALYPQDGRDGPALLRHADQVMYQAKKSGRDKALLARPALAVPPLQRRDLESDLRAAVASAQLQLAYQPQVALGSGRVHAVEALLRWNHPQRGWIAPQDIVALADAAGLLEPVARWVLETACAEAVAWGRAGTPVVLAVNLAPAQFRQAGLTQLVSGVLARTGLPPQRLELEFTEAVLLDHTADTRAALVGLAGLGTGLTLDDFGSGVASLAHLSHSPVGHVKIDQPLVAGLAGDDRQAALVRAVLALRGSLKLRVTAEGVETRAQALALQQLACDGLQGHFFSRPVAAAQVPELLARRWTLHDEPPTAGGNEAAP
jgi:EAL domain-containing protein (putative c-di-GMP-specific phosphodiesterase class I)